MKALTVWNPWAMLIAWGEKKIETRSWYTSYRGQLAIHAAKTFPGSIKRICNVEPYPEIFKRHGCQGLAELPYGCVVCTCKLINVLEIRIDGLYRHYSNREMNYPALDTLPIGNERIFGNYTPGRYAWILSNVCLLDKPIPTSGRQGLWEWDPPEDG